MNAALCLFLCIVSFPAVRNSNADKKGGNGTSLKNTNEAADFVKLSLNESVKPCDDFYKFACGGIIKSAEREKFQIPVSHISMAQNRLEQQLERMLNDSTASDDDPRPFGFLKRFHSACVRAEATQKDNVAAMKRILKGLGGWPVLEGKNWDEKSFDWKKFVYKARKIGYFYNSIVGVDVGYKTINIDYGILGYYDLSFRSGLNDTQVKSYFDLLVEIAMIFGASKEDAQRETKKGLNFEIQLAKIRDHNVTYQGTSLESLQKMYPDFPWLEFVTNIIDNPKHNLSASSLIHLVRPNYLKKLQPILCSTPKRDQANYLMYRGLLEIIRYWPLKLNATNLTMLYPHYATYPNASRSTKCASMITSSFYNAANVMYARKILSHASRRKIQELVASMKSAFLNALDHADWMDEITKRAASEKVSAMNVIMGYPDKLMSDEHLNQFYSQLNATSNHFVDLALVAQKHLEDKKFESLAQHPNETELMGYLGAVNVNYIPHKNTLYIHPAVLQHPFYTNGRPNYMNYGSLGVLIGRGITASIGERGRMNDKDGAWKSWWTNDTMACYTKKRMCFSNQYLADKELKKKVSSYQIDMNFTAEENFENNAAFETAYAVYTKWTQKNGKEGGLAGLKYTPNQLFWILAANTFCSATKSLSAEKNASAVSTSYLPLSILEKFRIIGSIRNSDNFAKDFNCPSGSPMHAEKKCKVWDNN